MQEGIVINLLISRVQNDQNALISFQGPAPPAGRLFEGTIEFVAKRQLSPPTTDGSDSLDVLV